MAGPIRVFVVDDHAVVRDGLVSLLRREAGMHVVGEAGDVTGALATIDSLDADVLVTDHLLTDGTGLDLAKTLADRGSSIRVLLVTGQERVGLIEDAVRAGCSGFVAKSQDTSELVAAIRAVANDEAVFPAAALRRVARRAGAPRHELSERELEVLRLLAAPHSVEAVAAELGVSVHTARNHVRSILAKLGVHSQLEAIVVAVRSGIIEIT